MPISASPVALTNKFVAADGFPICLRDAQTCPLYTRRGRVPVRVYSAKGDNARTILTFAWNDNILVVSVKM